MPWLILLIGPVGNGKTQLTKAICHRTTCVVIANDDIRQELFSKPSYSTAETTVTHRVARERIHEALLRGGSVIYDGNNLIRSEREELCHLISGTARILPVVVCAPDEVIRERMDARDSILPRRQDGKSWWEVYQQLRALMEPLKEPHFLVDSSQPFDAAVELVAALLNTSQ